MKKLVLLLAAPLALVACGDRAEAPAPTPTHNTTFPDCGPRGAKPDNVQDCR